MPSFLTQLLVRQTGTLINIQDTPDDDQIPGIRNPLHELYTERYLP